MKKEEENYSCFVASANSETEYLHNEDVAAKKKRKPELLEGEKVTLLES